MVITIKAYNIGPIYKKKSMLSVIIVNYFSGKSVMANCQIIKLSEDKRALF